MEVGNVFFRVAGDYIDFATIKTSDSGYVIFMCVYGDTHYKSGAYMWKICDFLLDWTLYTELNKALL